MWDSNLWDTTSPAGGQFIGMVGTKAGSESAVVSTSIHSQLIITQKRVEW